MHKSLVLAIGLGLCCTISVRAETILFESDEEVLIVRGRQAGSYAQFEFLANGDHSLQCVALSAEGDPLAVDTAFADGSTINFADLDVNLVDRVVCQRK